jgi:hypothetical protein
VRDLTSSDAVGPLVRFAGFDTPGRLVTLVRLRLPAHDRGIAKASRSAVVLVVHRPEMFHNEKARKIDGHREHEEIEVVGFGLAWIRYGAKHAFEPCREHAFALARRLARRRWQVGGCAAHAVAGWGCPRCGAGCMGIRAIRARVTTRSMLERRALSKFVSRLDHGRQQGEAKCRRSKDPPVAAIRSHIPNSLRGSPPPGTKVRCGVCQDDDNGDSRGQRRPYRSPGLAGWQCVADATSRPEDWRSAGRKGSDRGYEGAMPAGRRRRRSWGINPTERARCSGGRVEDANAVSGARRRVFLNSGGQDASSRKRLAEAEGCFAVPWRSPHPLGTALHKQ